MHTNRRSFLASAGVSALAAGASALRGQTQKPLRIAIVGTGHRAWAHLAILKSLPQYQVVALADPTPAFLDKAATMAPGAKTYSDYHKMLAEQKDVDAVIVITPSFLHSEVTVAALNKGLPVLCEKPMATRVEDANKMIEASKRSGKPLYIGFQKRLVPTTKKMHDLARAGEIGQIEFVSANLFRGDWNPESWKYTDPKTGVQTNWRYLTFTEGSAILEDGIHEIDSLNWIINGPVAHVTAAGGNNVYKDRETIDHASIIVEYESGVKLGFDYCLFGQDTGSQARRTVIIGNEGAMTPENGKVAIRSRKNPRAVKYVEAIDNTPKSVTAHEVGSAEDPETYQQYLLFEKTVRDGAPPLVAPEEAKNAIKLVLLAEKSVRTHRIMNWNDLPA